MKDTEKREKLLKRSKLADQMNDRMGNDFLRFAAMDYDQQRRCGKDAIETLYYEVDELLIFQNHILF